VKPTIRLANQDDSDSVIQFISEHWKRDHIFVHDRRLFDWQYLSSAQPDRLNFVVALDEVSSELLAILGFIPVSQFSRRPDWTETFGAIWKISEDTRLPGLGTLLLKFLINQIRPALIGIIGISRIALPIYRALGFCIGVMDHHVLFNPRRRNFSIAAGIQRHHIAHPSGAVSGSRCFPIADVHVTPALESLCVDSLPRKNWEYIRQRYLEHPIYRYHALAMFQNDEPRGILVTRKVHANNSAALRVVDYLGDITVLPSFRGSLQEILVAEDAEYIDVYQHGIPLEILARAGFVNRRAQDSLVVPNYFEPFIAANIELDFAYKLDDPKLTNRVRIFRGDGDQDRPNQLRENVGAV
jgi:hypothetical protein